MRLNWKDNLNWKEKKHINISGFAVIIVMNNSNKENNLIIKKPW